MKQDVELGAKGIAAIVPVDTAPGLKLSGVRVTECASQESANAEIRNVLEEKSSAVLILSDRFYKNVTGRLREDLDESVLPLLVNLPDTIRLDGSEEDHKQYIASMIKRAIGFQIKVN